MPSFIKSISIVSMGTLISRILGMVRDIIMASCFGASMGLDAFLLAFTIPNLFRRFFGEGAISSAFLPVFTDVLENESKEQAEKLASNTVTVLSSILLLIVFLGLGVSWIWPYIFQTSEKTVLALHLLHVMMPYMFFICLTAFLASILNSMNHFLCPVLAPIILNICWLGSLVLIIPFLGTNQESWAYSMAIAISVSGLLQVCLQIPALRLHNIKLYFLWNLSNPLLKRILYNFLPILLSATVVQLNMLMDWIFAWCMIPGSGAVSIMYMGNRLMQFPLALIGISLATVAFPIFTHYAVQKKMEDLSIAISRSLQLAIFLTLPAIAGLISLAKPIIHLLYHHNNFTDTDAQRTTYVLIAYCAGLCFFVFVQILSKAFYAIEESKIPTKVACIALVSNVVLNLFFVPMWKECGLAIATTITSCGNASLLLYILHRKINIPLLPIFKTFLTTSFCTILMTITVLFVLYFFPLQSSIISRLCSVFFPMLSGICIYFFLAYLGKLPELRQLLSRKL